MTVRIRNEGPYPWEIPTMRMKSWGERELEKRWRRWDAYDEIGFWRYWWLFLVAKLRESPMAMSPFRNTPQTSFVTLPARL